MILQITAARTGHCSPIAVFSTLSRALPRAFFHADVAQLVEQALRKRHVAGSSPAIGSNLKRPLRGVSLYISVTPLQSCVLPLQFRCGLTTSLRRSLLHLLPLGIVLTALLSGCGNGVARAGVLRLPVYGALGSPDPALTNTSAGAFLDSLLYTGLLKFGPDLHVIPELAVTIPTISADGRTYTFTVRQDARFPDGRRCTASDVAFSLLRAIALHSWSARHYLNDIEGAGSLRIGRIASLMGVQVVDPLTLRIRLSHPDADFLQKLALPVASVIDRRVLHRSRITSWLQTPAGTGPFIVAHRDRSGSLVLMPRPHFYGGRMQIRSLVVTPVYSTAAGLNLFHKGAIDAAAVPDGQFGKLAVSSIFHSNPGLNGYYVVPVGIGGDPALEANLNRTALVNVAWPELAPMDSIVPPAVPDYVPAPPQLSPAAIDPPTIGIHRGDIIERSLRDALYRQWGRPRSSNSKVRLIHAFNGLPDPAAWLRLALPHTRSRWYRHLLARAATLTNDPVTRMSGYSRAETWALRQGLVIPLANDTVAYLIKLSIQNLQVTPVGLMPANNNWATVDVS